MLFAGTDIETTGLEIGDHRIIEVAVGLYDENGTCQDFYEQRINPQRGISIDAQRVHGISSTDLMTMPTWDLIAPKMAPFLAKADFHVWHNGDGFDGPFMQHEFKRVGLTMPIKPSIDTMLHATWATPDGKKPRLQELAFACNVAYDPAKAHAARYDVDVMMECFFKALSWGYFELPKDGISEAA